MKKKERIEGLATAMLKVAAIRAGEPELADRYLEHHARETKQEHVHDWQPMDGMRGRYTCACGATGYRPEYGVNRQIREHKTKVEAPKKDKVHVGNSNLPSKGAARRGRRGPGSW